MKEKDPKYGTEVKRARIHVGLRCSLVVESLPGLIHALGLVPNTAKQNRKQQNQNPEKLGATLGQGSESCGFPLSVDLETAQWPGTLYCWRLSRWFY